MTCNMRSTQEAIIGDTFHKKDQPVEPLMEVEKPKPMVYAGFYPMDPKEQVRAIQPLVVAKFFFAHQLCSFHLNLASAVVPYASELKRSLNPGFLVQYSL